MATLLHYCDNLKPPPNLPPGNVGHKKRVRPTRLKEFRNVFDAAPPWLAKALGKSPAERKRFAVGTGRRPA
ncbi:hypothetical protein [Methylomicrobium agile]|uniref:hypothetical protein n=1 Tax=Methylomicrobium agile TaxID=39774 RepID=UPI000B1E6CEE|nr:hypothetical protein [Methylomicrobium agile]